MSTSSMFIFSFGKLDSIIQIKSGGWRKSNIFSYENYPNFSYIFIFFLWKCIEWNMPAFVRTKLNRVKNVWHIERYGRCEVKRNVVVNKGARESSLQETQWRHSVQRFTDFMRVRSYWKLCWMLVALHVYNPWFIAIIANVYWISLDSLRIILILFQYLLKFTRKSH